MGKTPILIEINFHKSANRKIYIKFPSETFYWNILDLHRKHFHR